MNARDALRRLREGNRRFVSTIRDSKPIRMHAYRPDPGSAQRPLAVVLGCSDSRVPAELVLGQGFGDLFVIRVAGNIVAPSQIGSVEFAADRFGTRLIVVLGHSHCGAVAATVEQLLRPTEDQSPNLRSIVDRVRPAVEPLLSTDLRSDPEALVQKAIRANILTSASQLRRRSEILRRLIEKDGLVVVGAEYFLETGVVEFFDGVDAAAEGVPPPAR